MIGNKRHPDLKQQYEHYIVTNREFNGYGFYTKCLLEAIFINQTVFTASEEPDAGLRTSSDTTENPFPAVPARLTSTAAFSAGIFVWKAISSIEMKMEQIDKITEDDLRGDKSKEAIGLDTVLGGFIESAANHQ